MGNDKVFSFKEQLGVGATGERMFIEFYGGTPSEDRKYDISHTDGKIELKTDTYSMEKTGNFFMEKFGSIEDSKIGGPWRAAQDDIDFFVYFYVTDKTFFWFKSKQLVEFLEKYTATLKAKTVRNKAYTTLGYAVPREALEHILFRKDVLK